MKRIEPISEPCVCGRMLTTTIPFISFKWVGLESPECPCGEGDSIAVARGRDEVTQGEMDALFRDFDMTLT
jgi:hypothetical protein